MKKKFIKAVLEMLGVITVGLFAFMQLGFKMWEETLKGPFYGSNYIGRVESAPISCLKLPGGAALHINRVMDSEAPVLSLRCAQGSIVWSRLLIAEATAPDGSTHRAQIYDIKLERIRRYKSGFKVYVRCDWNWGGKEAGIIYLKPDYSFQSFALGW